MKDAVKTGVVPAPKQPSQESRQWVFMATTGAVGPLTTEQFIKAVQSGQVQPKTMVRLFQNTEWITAEQITGIEFPQSVREAAPATGPPPVQESPDSHSAPNAEMRHLFAECISRQRSSLPAQPTSHSRSISMGQGSRVAGGITAAFSSVTGLFVSVVEWLAAAFIFLVKSRIVWAGVCLFLVALSIPRISASLVTQGQVLSTLEQTYSEFKDLQAREADQETWKEFQQRSSQTLAKLTPQLKKNAHVEDKISMSLMWMARDYFPELLNSPADSTTKTEQKIELHFATIKDAHRQAKQKQEKWDTWTMSIVVIDVLGVLAALLFFTRKR
ncbi:MAG: hypothetical protein U0929_01860 [Planctomycetaceae bacterium]